MISILFRLLFWLILSPFVHPYALLSPRAANLGIQFNLFEGKVGETTYSYAFYGGVAEYEKNVVDLFPNEDIWPYIAGLCDKALAEAKKLLEEQKAKNGGTYHPLTGMDTFVVGNKVYFASPLAGAWGNSAKYFFYEVMPEREPLRRQLQKCQLEASVKQDKEHRIHGNCGELVNMQMWLKDNPGQQWDPDTPAYSLHRLLYQGNSIWVKPCGDSPPKAGAWGCMYWADTQGIQYQKDPKKYFSENPVRETEIAPIYTRGVDTLWCPPEDGRTTAEQVGFRIPEEAPDPMPEDEFGEDADMLFDDFS